MQKPKPIELITPVGARLYTDSVTRIRILLSALMERHIQAYGGEPRVFKAPGRVNLIGEHTDYNEGYVLPTLIDRYLWVAISPREDETVKLQALDFDERIELRLSSIKYDKEHLWANYVLGVAYSLIARGYNLGGFDLSIHGDVPLGAGLSSSAALETAVVRGLNGTFSLGIDPVEMAYIGKQCENEFMGGQSGSMDQFVSGIGEYGKALFVDCRTNEHSLHNLDPDYSVVILNTMVSREVANSEYNLRKSQCDEATSIIQKEHPDIKALRDVDEEMLLGSRAELPEVVARRARHVVTENMRVLEALEMLSDDNMNGFGDLMYDSHDSLRHDYEVSCMELDVLVDSTLYLKGVLGARMTGAGFGGCTVNLVEKGYVDEFIETVSKRYYNCSEKRLEAYIA
jgi:galactokinase